MEPLCCLLCVACSAWDIVFLTLESDGGSAPQLTAAYTHIVIGHLPVVGLIFTLVVTLLGLFFSDRRLILIGCAFTVVCAIGAVIAYGSGPPAFDQLRGGLDKATVELAEQHAVIGRAAFIGAILAGIVALQGLLRTAADDGPSPWLGRGLAALLIVVAGLMAWTAHLGGGIRHPEARSESERVLGRGSDRSANADVQTGERPNPQIGECRAWHSSPGRPSVNQAAATNVPPGNPRRHSRRSSTG